MSSLQHLLTAPSFSPQNYINTLFKDSTTPKDDDPITPTQHGVPSSHSHTKIYNLLLQHHQSSLHQSLSTLSSKIHYMQQYSTDHVTLDDLEQSIMRLTEQLEDLVQKCQRMEHSKGEGFTQQITTAVYHLTLAGTPLSVQTRNSTTSTPKQDPYQQLKHWYSIRQKLEHCCKVLHAAQIVSEGIESVQKAMENAQSLMDDSVALKSITGKLIGVNKALQVLEQGGYESYFTHQKELVHRFEMRLEDIMRERFIEIMRKRTRWLARGHTQDAMEELLDDAKREARMLAQSNLLDRVFRQYVERECREPVLRVWHTIVQSQQQQRAAQNTPSRTSFSEHLTKLYEEILAYLNKDASLFSAVFQDTTFTPISTFITDILKSLTPPLTSLMKDHVSLPDMIQCFEQSKQFCSRVQAIMHAHSPVRNDATLLQQEIESVESQILLPFQQLQSGYATLERQYFNLLFDKNVTLYKYHSVDVDKLEEFITNIQDSMDTFFSTLRSGSERCLRFTSGKEYPAFVRVIENEIRRFAAKVSSTMSKFQSAYLTSTTEQQKKKFDDRLLIQHMLHYYQVAKNLFIRSIEFSREMQREILEHAEEICSQGIFSITEDKRRELERFLKEIASDELSLFKEGIERMSQMYAQAISCAQSALMLPVRYSLRNMPTLSVWHAKSSTSAAFSLPDMHFSPLDYIQRIYQHLVDLPGDLQMLDQDTNFEHENVETPNWLELVCAETVKLLKESILQIPLLTKDGRRQLKSDVAHFSPLLQILVQQPEPTLQELQNLLQCETKADFDSKRRQCTHLSHDFLRRLKKIVQF